MKNSYVMLNRHHYSVPKEYIGKRVDIVIDNILLNYLKEVVSQKGGTTRLPSVSGRVPVPSTGFPCLSWDYVARREVRSCKARGRMCLRFGGPSVRL